MGTKQLAEFKAELSRTAKYIVGMTVHWRGTHYRISARYYRRSMGWIVYDLKEIMPDGSYGRFQTKRRESELEDLPYKDYSTKA